MLTIRRAQHITIALALLLSADVAAAQVPWTSVGPSPTHAVWQGDRDFFYGPNRTTQRLGRSPDGVAFEDLGSRQPYDARVYNLLARDGLLVAAFGYTLVNPDPNGGGVTTGHLGVAVSRDQGETWTVHAPQDGLPPAESVQTFAEDQPSGRLYAVGVQTLYRSDDGGVSWVESGEGLPQTPPGSPVQLVLWDAAFRDGVGLLASSRGVFRSADGGRSWEPFSDGFAPGDLAPEVWTVAFSEVGQAFVGIRYDDRFNGVWRRDPAGWTRLPLPRARGDGNPNIPVDDLLAIHGRLYLAGEGLSRGEHDRVYVSADAGDSWTGLPDGLPGGLGSGAYGLFLKGNDISVVGGGNGTSNRYRRPLSMNTPTEADSDTQATLTRIFPNPARTIITIYVEGKSEPADVAVFDAVGRHVLAAYGRSPLQVDVSALPPGVYVAKTPRSAVSFVVAR